MNRFQMIVSFFLSVPVMLLASEIPYQGMGGFAGEVGRHSVILQTRPTASAERDQNGDMRGAVAWVRYEISCSEDFSDSWTTGWRQAKPENDYIVKECLNNLLADTRYFYRAQIARQPASTLVRKGERCTFRTAPGASQLNEVRFTVTTSHRHHNRESDLGFESYEALLRLRPDFNVLTGDNVYYDNDPPNAVDLPGMRMHWRRMYAMPRLVNFYREVPAYFMKDDHDYRFDDADPFKPPREGGSPDDSLGRAVFLEQAPVPEQTYRKVRWGKGVEIWFPEGRDFRSPNNMPDGPGKTMWGVEQLRWIEKTIRASDALFKIVCSPTPLLGPDGVNKRDSHANRGGFHHEGQTFLRRLKEGGVRNVYIVCGDRHWKYHSVHNETGYEEFCCGALTDGASVKDPDYSDPAVERKWYLGNGGFIMVRVEISKENKPTLVFDYYEKDGNLVHSVRREHQP